MPEVIEDGLSPVSFVPASKHSGISTAAYDRLNKEVIVGVDLNSWFRFQVGE